MTEYEFGGALNLDPSDYVSGADEAAQASDDVAVAADDMSESMWEIDAAGIAAGGALAGVGTAGQGILDDTRDMREQLGLAAETMGVTQEETEAMAQELSDATFPIEDATGAIDSLAQQGIDSEEDMLAVADAADEIADATGTSAESVADNLGPAITSLGDDIEDMPELADAFTLAVRDSNLETEDLAGVIERSSEELNEMGLGAEDAAGLISEYADETGKSGTRAARDFQSAINEADGDMDELIETTGLSEDVLEEWGDELEENEGIAEDHAQVAEDNASTMDHLRARFDDARLAAAGYLGPIDAIAPAAQTAAIGVMALSTVNTAALVPSFAAVTAAASGLILPIAAIGAAVTAAAVIWERDLFDIQERTGNAVEYITGGLETLVEGVDWAIDTASYILFEWSPGETLSNTRDRMLEPIDDVREFIPSSIDEATDLAMDAFTRFHPAGILWDRRDEVMDAASDIRDGLERRVSDATDRTIEVFMEWHPAEIVYQKRDEILDALPIPDEWRERGEALVSSFVDGVRDMIPNATGAVEDLVGGLADYLPSSDAAVGPLSNLESRGGAIPETLAEGVRENSDELEDSIEEMASAAVQGLTLDDAEEQLEEEMAALEEEHDELTEGGVSLEDQEEVAELSSQIDELREQRDELADAESIAEADAELLAGVALEQAEEEEREAQALAEVEAIVQEELGEAAPDGMIAGPDGPESTTTEADATSFDTQHGQGQPTDDESGESLTKDDRVDVIRSALEEFWEGRSLHVEQSINERELRGIIEDVVDAHIT